MARKKAAHDSRQAHWLSVHDRFRESFPHVFSVLEREEDFISLLLKAKDDGTCLAVLKQFGPDGAPMVCFGSGYGAVACILGLDASIQGNKWRVDTPWDHKNGRRG